MPTPVQIPKATITMEEATLLQWMRQEGDAVAKDDLLFELETDKAVMEVPAPAGGVLLKILTRSGAVKVDQIVGWVGAAGEQAPSDAGPHPERVAASPAARRRAKETGVDLSKVAGTGPGGRITEDDVERAIPTAPQRNKALVERLSTAWREAPHIHIARKLDAAGILKIRECHAGVSVTDILIHAAAQALHKFPSLTTSQNAGISFAVDTLRGVVAPVIHAEITGDLSRLSVERRRLSAAARDGKLAPADLEGGAFTVTNLGMLEVDFFAPVLNHPQVAILAVGRISEEPVVENGEIRIGHRIWANLAADHRVVDGAEAARFLIEFQAAIRS